MLVDMFQAAGEKEIIWNGTDDEGTILSSGLYIYMLKTAKNKYYNKMLFLK